MKQRLLIAAAIFCAALAFNSWITSSGNFPDPDSFYHLRMALLMRQTPVVRDFPWLTQTVFVDSYVDHHWGYHLLLVPFVAFGDPVVGMRVITLLLASAVPAAVFLLVAGWGSWRVGLAAAALLIVNNPFSFRMNLAKVPAFSVLIILASLWAMGRRKRFLLACIAALYVWSYNGWPLVVVVAGAYAAATLADAFLAGGRRALRRWTAWREAFAPVAAVLCGVAFALVVNPYFPDNIFFSWLHIVRIGIIGFRDAIGVGGEWYALAPLNIVAQSSFIFGFILVGVVSLIVALGVTRGGAARDAAVADERRRLIWMILLAAGTFVLAARSRRNIEYFVPFAALAAAALVVFAARVISPGERWKLWQTVRSLRRWLVVSAALVLFACVPFILARDIGSLKNDYDTGIPPTRYAGAAAWLDAHAPEGAILWHNDWDDFPYFFLHTTHVRFIVGLDPAFMYVHNPDRYWQWVRETKGEGEDRIGREIARDFGASYAFVDSDHHDLAARFAADSDMIEVYRDAEGIIYALPKP